MWYVVVFFMSLNADGSQPLYIFTEPRHATEKECRITLTHTPSIEKYMGKLMLEYNGQVPKIKGVNCIGQEMFDRLKDMSINEQGVTI